VAEGTITNLHPIRTYKRAKCYCISSQHQHDMALRYNSSFLLKFTSGQWGKNEYSFCLTTFNVGFPSRFLQHRTQKSWPLQNAA